jgi:alkaline phosphatase
MKRPQSRRDFLKASGLTLSAGAIAPLLGGCSSKPVLIGLLTDVHYADRDTRGSRHYRDSLAKVAAAVETFNGHGVDFVVHMGDLIDSGDGSVESELKNLQTIEVEFSKCRAPRHYVLGNHCVDLLSKAEFAAHSAAKAEHYSFDSGAWHFVILDSCFTKDGDPYARKNFHWQDANIPGSQLDWLRDDLHAADRPVIVFVHQRLDDIEKYGVKNREAVRAVLEESGKVFAVFQGHSHKNEWHQIADIHYVTLRAMVENAGPENTGYGLLYLDTDGTAVITGYGQQEHWTQPPDDGTRSRIKDALKG